MNLLLLLEGREGEAADLLRCGQRREEKKNVRKEIS
jgi:hypothetical protein